MLRGLGLPGGASLGYWFGREGTPWYRTGGLTRRGRFSLVQRPLLSKGLYGGPGKVGSPRSTEEWEERDALWKNRVVDGSTQH